ncbi:hypothetical protein LWI29_030518 [Acer saccharum]|uniref:Uncharacterized protein n=1 Tax=Acer saccharum TaxID=4024 RepID=A0AA39VJF3_ACESA|nr:hypothetical protein LWI29_030518 [Acer saccharum]
MIHDQQLACKIRDLLQLMSYKGAGITIAGDENSQTLCGDGVYVEIKKIESNTGRVGSKIEIDASLDTVWNILTDYEKFVNLVPCVAASHLIEKKANISRVHKFNGGNCEEDDIDSSLITRKFKTVRSYEAVVKPKPWMPVRLVAGILGKEIKVNISCIREAAQKVIN